ncbi:Insect cuticle protein [Trinorchestia longiramus]|nr:Insect cuticle protein [Trinorchestia longiramus]
MPKFEAKCCEISSNSNLQQWQISSNGKSPAMADLQQWLISTNGRSLAMARVAAAGERERTLAWRRRAASAIHSSHRGHEVHIGKCLLVAAWATAVTAQLSPLFRHGRIFNFRAWSGRPGPYLKRHPIPIRLYTVPPQQLHYYFPTQHYSTTSNVAVRQPEPQYSSYQTVPYVYPPNDFDAVKSLNFSGDPFLKSNIQTHSSIDTLPLEPFHQNRYEGSILAGNVPSPQQDSQIANLDSAIVPASIFSGLEYPTSHIFSQQSVFNAPIETVTKNSEQATHPMYAALPTKGAKIDPIIASEVDSLAAPGTNPLAAPDLNPSTAPNVNPLAKPVVIPDINPFAAPDINPLVEAELYPLVEAEIDALMEAEIDPLIKNEIDSLIITEIDSVVADDMDGEATAQDIPVVDTETDSRLASEIVPVEAVIRNPEDEIISEETISTDSPKIVPDSNVISKKVPVYIDVTSGTDKGRNTYFKVLSPQVASYMTSSVSLLSNGFVEHRRPETFSMLEQNTVNPITEGHTLTSSVTVDSPSMVRAKGKNASEETRHEIFLNDKATSVNQESSADINNFTDEITVIRKIYPVNQHKAERTNTEASADQFNKDLFITHLDESKNLENTSVTSSVPFSKERENDKPNETQDESLFIEVTPSTNNIISNSSNNYNNNETLLESIGKVMKVVELLPEPPRPLVPPISTRASPTFLLRRLKEKFPHRAAFQETIVASGKLKEVSTLKEESFLPPKNRTHESNENTEVPNVPGLLISSIDDEDKSEEKPVIASVGIGDLPQENHVIAEGPPDTGVSPLPGTLASESGEPVRGYRFSYSVEDDHSGSSYSRYEKSDGVLTQGQYSVLLPDGRTQVVKFFDDGLDRLVFEAPNKHDKERGERLSEWTKFCWVCARFSVEGWKEAIILRY